MNAIDRLPAASTLSRRAAVCYDAAYKGVRISWLFRQKADVRFGRPMEAALSVS